MIKDKLLTFAVAFLGLTILVSGVQISRSITSSSKVAPQSLQIESRNDDILSTAEAAVYLKVSESKLTWLVENSKYKDGEGIPYYKMDKTMWFSKAALSKWVIHIADNRHEY